VGNQFDEAWRDSSAYFPKSFVLESYDKVFDYSEIYLETLKQSLGKSSYEFHDRRGNGK
jgi:hypothetical protein